MIVLSSKNCFRIDGDYSGRSTLDFGIKEGDKVLDIGGGIKSFVHATHVLDSTDTKFNAQRYGAHLTTSSGQILIDGTTDNLGDFEDNEFDFIYTSHTLEHVVDLPQALEEISRVGKRGFITVPHHLYDFWAVPSSSGHEWFCDYRDDVFLIRKRLPNDYLNHIAKEWENLMWGEDWDKTKLWRYYWEGHFCISTRPFWEIRFFWEDWIDYKVDDTMFYQLDVFREIAKQAREEQEKIKKGKRIPIIIHGEDVNG
jgi:SAM-dependent methyltransferase